MTLSFWLFFAIFATGFTIVTDEGAWRGVPDVYLQTESSGDQILVGEGEYDGLCAYLFYTETPDGYNVEGMIFPGEMPVSPEPRTAE